jgi:hypothetical protein
MYYIFDQAIIYNYLGKKSYYHNHIELCDFFQFQNIFNIHFKNSSSVFSSLG